MEVEGAHAYTVSDSRIVVHNEDEKLPCNVEVKADNKDKKNHRKTPTYKLKSIWKKYTGKKATGEIHHGLPEEFRDWFSRREINVNSGEYFFDLPKDVHRLISGEGIHTNSSPLGGEWNSIWEKFIDDHPNASKEEILVKLNDMAKKAKIDIYRAVKKE